MALVIRWQVELAYLDPKEAKLIHQVETTKTVDIPNTTTENNQPTAAATAAFAALGVATTFVDPLSGNTINRSIRVQKMQRVGEFTV